MSDNWIKSLGSADHPLPDDWQHARNGLFHKALTFAKRPGLARGDGVVLYAAGTGMVFAVGRAVGDPYLDVEDMTDWPWRIDVSLDYWRPFVHEGEALDVLSVEERDLRKSIRRHSHIRLSDAEFAAATRALGR